MLRINLLPREVIDKHRFASWYRFIIVITLGVAAAILLIALGLNLLVQQKASDLQAAQDTVAKLTEQGKAFDVFEKNEKDLADRQAIAQTALATRMNLGKIAEEISLVLPEEVWLDSLVLDQTTGMSAVGNTPRSTSQSANQSYKSVARTIVRLNELPQLTDVWLSGANNAEWSRWDTASTVTTPAPVVQFTTTSKIIPSDPTTKTPVVDAR